MAKASGCTSAGTVGELELDLLYPTTGAYGVDGHPDLHAKAVRERQHVFERSLSEGSLSGDGSARPRTAATTNRPAGEAECEPKATADRRGEDCYGDISVPLRDRVGQCHELDCGVTEIAVAEDED